MSKKSDVFKDFLENYFNELRKKNPRFSLRAFSKKLNMSPGSLSLLLSGKRAFSDKTINKICDELCLAPMERKKIFSDNIDEEVAKILEQSIFETISNWVHDAFLALLQIKEYRQDHSWICYRLGISKQELERVVINLTALGLITTENRRYVTTNAGTQVFAEKSTTAALKKLQLDANTLSRLAIEGEKLERRYHGINTLTIDPTKMEEAKQYIRDFRKKFCIHQSWCGDKARVYQLNISLYPVDQEKSS